MSFPIHYQLLRYNNLNIFFKTNHYIIYISSFLKSYYSFTWALSDCKDRGEDNLMYYTLTDICMKSKFQFIRLGDK